jgi:cytochrome c oxidase accessory protein FixG
MSEANEMEARASSGTKDAGKGSLDTSKPGQDSGKAEPDVVWLYQASKKIYPRSVDGTFARWRWFFVFLTQAVFYLTPWLQWGNRQAVLFDLGARRFYIFGLVIYPQDFIFLTGLLILSAMSLFMFTAIAGRQWCGYACPQTVYTEIFMWIERKIEGDRSARMRLDQSPMSLEKFLRKAAKQLAWIAVGLWTGFTFVGYFTPIRELGHLFLTWNMGPWETFWVFFYGFATYGNGGYMREQVCKYMCPYARFQSAMFDKDTLIVSYDAERGEPRGPRPRKADPKALGLGDCIDCTLCVQVCPTGIDIRNGLQYECISCAACIDVCDGVMEKMGYPKGLIRYTTQNAMREHWTKEQVVRHMFRPRVLVYLTIITVVLAAMITALVLRPPLKADVVRDRATLARIVEGGQLENVYRIQIMNAREEPQRVKIDVRGLKDIRVASENVFSVGPAEARWVVVTARVPYGVAEPGTHPIEFTLEALEHPGKVVVEKSVFIIPR